MRPQHEIKDMLQRFEEADESGDVLTCDGEAVLETLRWVSGKSSTANIEEFLEDM